MIVGRGDLDCRPVADAVLAGATGPGAMTIDRGAFGWSNEFVLHVLEAKNLVPVAELGAIADGLAVQVREMNRALGRHGLRLMPTAMHPWLDPAEARPWPDDPHGIYKAFRRIFDTATHGWTNIQSVHLNLPFAGDAEFARLHEAIRRVLPLIPALAASSPLCQGRLTGWRDTRMHAYRANAGRFPLVNGAIIPEIVASRAEYEARILAPVYESLSGADPEGALRHEWVNARGAIARFDRSTIEIRVVDAQECPEADLAVAAAIVTAIRSLFDAPERLAGTMATDRLAAILDDCIRSAEDAVIADPAFLRLFRWPGAAATAAELWSHILDGAGEALVVDAARWRPAWQAIRREGTLSRRIARAVGPEPSRARLTAVYADLCDCLARNEMFLPG